MPSYPWMPAFVSDVVLTLVCDGDISVTAIELVEGELAFAVRNHFQERDTLGARNVTVIDRVVECLRQSPHVDRVISGDRVLRRKILGVLHPRGVGQRGSSDPSAGGAGFPPSGSGNPSGGHPAEARVSDEAPRPRSPDPDLNRRERKDK
jgi:hypothetical protein